MPRRVLPSADRSCRCPCTCCTCHAPRTGFRLSCSQHTAGPAPCRTRLAIRQNSHTRPPHPPPNTFHSHCILLLGPCLPSTQTLRVFPLLSAHPGAVPEIRQAPPPRTSGSTTRLGPHSSPRPTQGCMRTSRQSRGPCHCSPSDSAFAQPNSRHQASQVCIYKFPCHDRTLHDHPDTEAHRECLDARISPLPILRDIGISPPPLLRLQDQTHTIHSLSKVAKSPRWTALPHRRKGVHTPILSSLQSTYTPLPAHSCPSGCSTVE
mmetsp:Transcript_28380/g.55554  ORF Transcript_28380/g.55554 Transcript_28380/m.55554 type:complete len:264 (-) Transcript_28380:366-1157(-)